MPLTRISLKTGTTPDYRRALMDQIYLAMGEVFDVPEGDRFITLTEHDPDGFSYGAEYLGISRSDRLVMIQITANNTRSAEMKKALYARIVARLAQEPGVRPEDVFINIVEVAKENWSFGYGLAQYA